jgi:hypothetical protein
MKAKKTERLTLKKRFTIVKRYRVQITDGTEVRFETQNPKFTTDDAWHFLNSLINFELLEEFQVCALEQLVRARWVPADPPTS